MTVREQGVAQQFATKNLNPAAGVVVPLELSLSGSTGITSGRSVSASLSFTTPVGGVACSYFATAGASPPIRLSFVSCTNGALVGAQIGSSQTRLSGSVSGTAFASATLSISNLATTVDDGTACTQDICTNNVISHPNAPAGTSCDDGLACNGINTCNGSGACITGTPPQKDDGDPCTNDAPTTCTEPLGFTHTKISGCGAPTTVPPYPGNGQVASDFASGTSFIYTGGTQTGLTNSITSQRAAVIRGRVVDRDSQAGISGATVTLLGQSGYGSTQTRSDGFYDLVVNGGDTFTVQVAKTGYPTVQRKIETRWLDFSVVPDIALVLLDTPTAIGIDGSGRTDAVNWTSVTATAKTDSDGTRTAKLLIPPATTIGGWTPSGSTVSFRITEFTVGSAGRAAMPAELPFNSAYTYASELTIDQVPNPTFTNSFGNSVMFYVDHFTGPSLNTNSVSVPAGYYDGAAGSWKPEPSGVIVRILNTNGGVATLSLDGTTPMTPAQQTTWGITSGELTKLGALYSGAVNKDLWRVRMTHFSPYDLNWNAGVDPSAVPPPKAQPRADTPSMCPVEVPGSVIECENQVLGERVPIMGTPFSLNYRSEAQSGYLPTLTIPISDSSAGLIPTTFDHGEVDISVAGKHVLLTFPKPLGSNERLKWTWDRTDAYGRLVQGTVTAHVRVSYAYKSKNTNFTTNFGSFGAGAWTTTTNRGLRLIRFDNMYDLSVGGFDSKQLGLGGWTVDAMHVYEPQAKIVWFGDGTKRIPSPLGDIIDTPFNSGGSTGYGLNSVLATGNGTIYVTRHGTTYPTLTYIGTLANGTVTPLSRIITPIVTTFTNGASLSTFSVQPDWVSRGPDGRIYVLDRARIVAFDPGPSLASTLFAGPSTATATGGNIPITADGQVAAGSPMGPLAFPGFGSDGLLYFVESTTGSGTTGALVRRVRANGTLETVAGNGGTTGVPGSCATSNTCAAIAQPLAGVRGLTFDSAGRLLFYETTSHRVWRIEGDNTLRLVAGNGGSSPTNDGGPATGAGIAVTSMRYLAGAIYLTDGANYITRRVSADGVITRVAGNGVSAPFVDNVPATTSYLGATDVSLAPDGKFYAASDTTIRRFGAPLDPIVGTDAYVTSSDGSEVYQFNASGQHVATKSPYRGTALYQLAYWPTGSPAWKVGKLWTITDNTATANGIAPDHNVTTFDYPTAAQATITSPYGVVTTLDVTTGYATTISNPGQSYTLGYNTAGLLTTFRDPKNQLHTFLYGPTGLLVSDANPFAAPYATTLARWESNTADNVQVATPEYRITNHLIDYARITTDAQRYERRTHTDPAGIVTLDDRRKDGTETVTNPQLSGQLNTIVQTVSAEPRFGFGSPYTSKVVTTAGASGSPKTNTMNVSTTAVLTNPFDPFSLSTSGVAITTTTSYTASSGTLGTSKVEYDRAQSKRTLTSALLRTTVETLDATDRTTAVSYGGSIPNATATSPATEAYTFDGAGRLTQESVTGGSTRSVTYAFDSISGWLSTITATGLGQVAYSNWDAVGRPRHVVLPGSRNVDLVYDANGNVTQVTTPMTYVHGLTPNAKDLLSTYVPPAVVPGGSTSFFYDRDGLIRALTEPVDTTNFNRDGAGRLATLLYPTLLGTQSVATTYDAAGHVSILSSNLGPVLTYTYDGDMVTQEAYTGIWPANHTVDKQYDGFQRVTTQKLDNADPSFGFAYDSDGLLSNVAAINGTTTNYAITRTAGGSPSAHGLVSGTTIGVVSDTYEYDAFGALVHYKATTPGVTVYEVFYEREPLTGRVSAKTETLNGIFTSCRTDYLYDAANFLQQATRNANCGIVAGVKSWTYDLDGNNTTGGKTYPNAQDRLTYDGLWNYDYDADGNVTNMSNWLMFNYDAPGNLRRWYVNTGGGASFDFAIDGRNRRVAKRASSGGALQKGWLYDGGQVIAELDSAGALSSHFAYATKRNVPDLMWHKDGSTWNLYRIVSDQLGSPMALVNITAGTLDPEKYAWDEWGASFGWYTSLPVGSPVKQPFGFAGGFFDADVGNYRFGARDYNPWIGRWWSRDPSRFAGGLNLYVYANNDPVNRIDPSGHFGTGLYLDDMHAAYAEGLDGRLDYWDDNPLPTVPTATFPDDGGHVHYFSCDYVCRLRASEVGRSCGSEEEQGSSGCGGSSSSKPRGEFSDYCHELYLAAYAKCLRLSNCTSGTR